MASNDPGFFEELKRRHVWRVAVAYAIVGWLAVQVATQVFPAFHMPDWTAQFVVILVVIGFPIALVLAWAFELTPEGIRRTEPAQSPDARTPRDTHAMGRKLNTIIIAVLVLVLAVLLLLGNQFLWHRGMRGTAVASAPAPAVDTSAPAVSAAVPPLPASTAAIPEKSVAVLPFANESGKADEQFFSDGLSEDLITALSQFAGLKVISRNSAFQFRDSKDTSAKIGELLGVAHLLEGSVRRAGDEVRITATLVNASDGTVLWTEHYDKPYTDLFALQDAITQSVADALKAKLLTTPGAVVQSDRPPGGSLAAYTAYQQGVAYFALQTEAGSHQAIAAFDQAIQLDPKYAAAYAQLSRARAGIAAGGFLTDPARIAQAQAAARKAVATALQLDQDSAQAHAARANLLSRVDMDWTGAAAEYRRALQLAPNNAEIQFGLGNVLATLGQNQRALGLTRQALASDPRHANWYGWLGVYLSALGQQDEAQKAIDTAIALQPGAVDLHYDLAVVAILQGDAKAALAAAQAEPPAAWHDIAMALALQIGPDRAVADAALQRLIKDMANSAPYQIAEVYALRRDPDAMFHWLDRAWANRDPGIGSLLMDPLILRYRNDPRFAAFCKKVGLPATTDAVAMK